MRVGLMKGMKKGENGQNKEENDEDEWRKVMMKMKERESNGGNEGQR